MVIPSLKLSFRRWRKRKIPRKSRRRTLWTSRSCGKRCLPSSTPPRPRRFRRVPSSTRFPRSSSSTPYQFVRRQCPFATAVTWGLQSLGREAPSHSILFPTWFERYQDPKCVYHWVRRPALSLLISECSTAHCGFAPSDKFDGLTHQLTLFFCSLILFIAIAQSHIAFWQCFIRI